MGDEVILFTENDYMKITAGFLETFYEYEKLEEQMQADIKGYPTWEPLSIDCKGTEETKEKEIS